VLYTTDATFVTTSAGENAVSIGEEAGMMNQGGAASAIGLYAGRNNQGYGAIAIGNEAGYNLQGAGAIAIGSNAGYFAQAANSIIIDANSSTNPSGASGVYVAPMRNNNSFSNILYYDESTKEITYGTSTGTSFATTSLQVTGTNGATGATGTITASVSVNAPIHGATGVNTVYLSAQNIQVGTGATGATGTITASAGISGTTLTSTVATGTAPLTVTSTTNVANLNASTLSGNTFVAPGNIGTTTPGGLTGTGLYVGGATGTLGATGSITAANGITNTAGNIIGPSILSGATGATGFIGATGSLSAINAYFSAAYVNGVAVATGAGSGATITNDNASAGPYYPVMSNATSGSFTTAYTASTGLYFNPSSGTINATIFNSLSDIQYKDNVQVIPNAIDVIKKLDGVSFNWKKNGKKSYGVIAQDIEKVLPELVDGDNPKSVNYSGIIAFLINAIKEQQEQINELKAK
jgi:hypothetical protein